MSASGLLINYCSKCEDHNIFCPYRSTDVGAGCSFCEHHPTAHGNVILSTKRLPASPLKRTVDAEAEEKIAKKHKEEALKTLNNEFIKPNNDTLYDFLRDVAKKFEEKEGIIELPRSTKFGTDREFNRYYNRQCYKELIDQIHSIIKKHTSTDVNSNTIRILLTGNAGIGKTTFITALICFWLSRARSAGGAAADVKSFFKDWPKPPANLILEDHVEGSLMVMEGFFDRAASDIVVYDYFNREHDLNELLRNNLDLAQSCLHIINCGKEGKYANALNKVRITIAVASNDRKHFKQFITHGSIETLYMPVWSFQEALAALPIFSEFGFEKNVETDDKAIDFLSDRFEKVGGCVRHLFATDGAFKNHVHGLENRINSLSTDGLFQLVDKINSIGIDEPQSIFHFSSSPPYDIDTFSIAWASSHVEKKVVERAEKADNNFFRLFINKTRYSTTMGPARGFIFEDFAIRLLSKGGKFKIKQQVPSDRREPFPSSSCLKFDTEEGKQDFLISEGLQLTYFNDRKMTAAEMDAKSDKELLVPFRHNAPSLDALIQPNIGLQIKDTADINPSIGATGLERFYSYMGDRTTTNPLHIIWVVPDYRYDSFGRPTVNGSFTDTLRDRSIVHWVLSININEEEINCNCQKSTRQDQKICTAQSICLCKKNNTRCTNRCKCECKSECNNQTEKFTIK